MAREAISIVKYLTWIDCLPRVIEVSQVFLGRETEKMNIKWWWLSDFLVRKWIRKDVSRMPINPRNPFLRKPQKKSSCFKAAESENRERQFRLFRAAFFRGGKAVRGVRIQIQCGIQMGRWKIGAVVNPFLSSLARFHGQEKVLRVLQKVTAQIGTVSHITCHSMLKSVSLIATKYPKI